MNNYKFTLSLCLISIINSPKKSIIEFIKKIIYK